MNGGGPATQNGKAVVGWNATRHGISSPAPVVPGLERTEDWQAHSDGVLESLQPEGHLETVLAQRVALVSWRLHRVTRYETGAITTAQERLEEDFHDKRRLIAAMMGERFAETHPTDIRWLARYRKQAHNALKRYSSQEPDKVLKGEDASSVVCEALSAAIKRSGQEIEDEDLDLPGGLQEQYELTELPAMKAAVVRECVEAIAAYASLDADELLEAATEEARFQAAVADGLIPRNAAAGLKLPRIIREEVDPLNQEEARRLLEAACGDRLGALYVLAINTGMREGELLALKWDDVDLERGVLRVRRTLSRTDKGYVLGEPKTKKSRRTIRLTAGAVEALRAHLSRQLKEMERVGSLYQPGGLVFATTTGTLINPSNLRNRSFKPLLRRAGLRPIRFHDLRHTCATLLLSKDVSPKVVSEMLGHASVSITLDIYSHLLPDMQEKAARALEDALS